MPIETRAFRQTAGLLTTGVTVIAARDGAETHAMTANAVTSLSLEPMLMLVCIAKRAKMAGLLAQAAGFSINILRAEQRSLSTYFAGGWQGAPPPFRFVAWQGGPRLEGCLAALGCNVQESVEGGDHWIVVGRVVALHQGIEPRRPLVFYAGRYRDIDFAAGESAPDVGWVEGPTHVYYDPWQPDL